MPTYAFIILGILQLLATIYFFISLSVFKRLPKGVPVSSSEGKKALLNLIISSLLLFVCFIIMILFM